MPVPRVAPVLLFINSKTLELEKQPEMEREGGKFKHENKHGQEAGKENEEDQDGKISLISIHGAFSRFKSC